MSRSIVGLSILILFILLSIYPSSCYPSSSSSSTTTTTSSSPSPTNNEFEPSSRVGCVDSGSCHLCNQSEKDMPVCKRTGKKIKIICNGYDNDEYRSCDLTSEDEQFRVLIFQGAMAIIGSLAFWGVQVRKSRTLTLFENRKLR